MPSELDNDRDLDILIVNLNRPPSLLRNDMKARRNRMKFKLEGVKSNRSTISTRVLAHYRKVQRRPYSAGAVSSCDDSRLHFGLGTSNSADLDVSWPNGLRGRFEALPADRLFTLREGWESWPIGAGIRLIH